MISLWRLRCRLSGLCGLAFLAVGPSCAADPAENAQAYRNDEYGIDVIFPTRACVAVSGSHPVGFYALLGQPTNCDAPKPALASSISITANYNSSFKTTPASGVCRDGEKPSNIEANLDGLAFADLQSVRCVLKMSNGQVAVIIAAQGGRWQGNDFPPEVKGAPSVNYSVVLTTSPQRLTTDLRVLRELVHSTRIRPPTLQE